MDQHNVQADFFLQIKNLLPAHVSMVDEIAGLLEISTDSVYRRIRGEKAISFEEIGKLGVRFKISIDQLLQLKTNGFIFTGTLGHESDYFVEDYLNYMFQQFEQVRIQEEKHIYFLASDIPPFDYFQIPELAAFTFFYYKKSLLHFEEMNDVKFSVKNMDDAQSKLGLKVQKSFNQIPSTEIWNIDTINGILRHILFYTDTHMFDTREDIICLYEKLEDLLNHLELQAQLGLKFNLGETPGTNAATYQLYHNDLMTGDNCAYVEHGDNKLTYISHNLFNFMYTRDDAFNHYTRQTFQNAIQKSIQISLVGEKARAGFFNRLRRKIKLQQEGFNGY